MAYVVPQPGTWPDLECPRGASAATIWANCPRTLGWSSSRLPRFAAGGQGGQTGTAPPRNGLERRFRHEQLRHGRDATTTTAACGGRAARRCLRHVFFARSSPRCRAAPARRRLKACLTSVIPSPCRPARSARAGSAGRSATRLSGARAASCNTSPSGSPAVDQRVGDPSSTTRKCSPPRIPDRAFCQPSRQLRQNAPVLARFQSRRPALRWAGWDSLEGAVLAETRAGYLHELEYRGPCPCTLGA